MLKRLVVDPDRDYMAQEFSRQDRVAELLRRELAQLIMRGMKDPRVEGVQVNGVRVSRDLAYATVLVSSFDEDAMPDALKALSRASGHLRHRLGRELTLRHIPELRFKYDDTEAKAARLDALIDRARAEDRSHGADDPEDDRSE